MSHTNRYTHVAIALHWVIALAIVLQLASGLWMSDAIHEAANKALAFKTYQWHKSLGLCVLMLSLFRLMWRLTHPAPALPAGMKRWQRMAAHAAHILFYVIMIGMPLLGWVMVSTSKFGLPTFIFGLFEWPHLPLGNLANKETISQLSTKAHELVAFGLIGLIALHIGAALGHQFFLRDGLLARMVPWLKKKGN